MYIATVEEGIARRALAEYGLTKGVVYFDRNRGNPRCYVEGKSIRHSTPEQREGHVFPHHKWITGFWVIIE